MTQEDKELLLKDLCARLPYGVKCYGYCFKIDGNHCECYGTLDSIKLGAWYPFHLSNRMSINNGATYEETFSEIKPYLFPLSSMTEEQRNDISKLLIDTQKEFSPYGELNMKGCDNLFICTVKQASVLINYCLTHYLDINGLIPKGLAIDATGLNIY
jgi:hypothetical protein